jgi:hypothetical protein
MSFLLPDYQPPSLLRLKNVARSLLRPIGCFWVYVFFGVFDNAVAVGAEEV